MEILTKVWDKICSHKKVIIGFLISAYGYQYVIAIVVRPIMIGVFVLCFGLELKDAIEVSIRITSFN